MQPHPTAAIAQPTVAQSAEAVGGNAINATGEANVSVGEAQRTAPTHEATGRPQQSAEQKARAGPAGTAINAADSAGVSVERR